MNGTALLALDQGGHGSRALLFDGAGRLLHTAWRPVGETRPAPDRVEQDPLELAATLRECAEEAAATARRLGLTVAAAALATQRSSLCCWDRGTAEPLSPVLSWQDRRNAGFMAARAREAEEIGRRTGLPPSPHYGAAKLRWCLDHLPAVAAARRAGRLCAGPLAAWLLAALLEERPCAVDAVNASRTLLCNLHTGDWDPWLLECFGIPRDILPRAADNCGPFGHLALDGERVPLALCTGDQAAALFAWGPPPEDEVEVNVGTGAFASLALAAPRPERHGLLLSVIHRCRDEVRHALEGTVNGAAGALDQVMADGGLDPATAWARLDRWLDEETAPPLFLNGVGGLGAPFWRPGFPSRFIGGGSAPARLVAVVESIVFLLGEILERMPLAEHGVRRIRISGGLAALDGLCRRLAAVSGLPVARARQCEATAQGAARLAARLAAGDAAWPGFAPERVFTPEPDPGLARRRTAWREALHRALSE